MKRLIPLLVSLLLTSSLFSQKIVGYIPQYRSPAVMDATIEWSGMTDAYYFGSVPTAAGGITIESPASFQHVLTRSTEYGLNAWLCVGGWNKSGNFISVATNATARQAFADEALRLCQLHGLKGIDIDWEFPQAGQETDFRNFLKTLYETLNPAGYLVSAACGGEQGHADRWQGDIFDYIDDLNIMSYDA
ncbi:glycoside hydrolase family 18 protein, partial [Cyclobacteriaceae bacterium]|nr:glycoside hydrolase family 18 protein [Cyclobacteriaceae bacterium]